MHLYPDRTVEGHLRQKNHWRQKSIDWQLIPYLPQSSRKNKYNQNRAVKMGISNNEKEPLKCPKCQKKLDEEHAKLKKVGIYVGNGGDLGWHIIKKVYNKEHFYEHPFFYLSGLESEKEDIVINAIAAAKTKFNTRRCGIEAHHLICSAHFKDRRIQKYIYLLGYNVNHYKNGVLLPTLMKVACSFKVPLHKGGHDVAFVLNTEGKEDIVVSVVDKAQELKDANYAESTKKMLFKVIRDIKRKNLCNIETLRKEAKRFINDMDKASQKVYRLIRTFQWTLTSDGFDYQKGRFGCLDSNKLPEKRKKLNSKFNFNLDMSKNVQEIQGDFYNNKEKLREVYGAYTCKHKKYKNPLAKTKPFIERGGVFINPLEKVE